MSSLTCAIDGPTVFDTDDLMKHCHDKHPSTVRSNRPGFPDPITDFEFCMHASSSPLNASKNSILSVPLPAPSVSTLLQFDSEAAKKTHVPDMTEGQYLGEGWLYKILNDTLPAIAGFAAINLSAFIVSKCQHTLATDDSPKTDMVCLLFDKFDSKRYYSTMWNTLCKDIIQRSGCNTFVWRKFSATPAIRDLMIDQFINGESFATARAVGVPISLQAGYLPAEFYKAFSFYSRYASSCNMSVDDHKKRMVRLGNIEPQIDGSNSIYSTKVDLSSGLINQVVGLLPEPNTVEDVINSAAIKNAMIASRRDQA